MTVNSPGTASSLAWSIRKWRALFSIYFQDGLAYRASGIIWVMTDLTTGITMPFVWASAQRAGGIAGYQTSDFVLYYLCMLLLTGFVTSHLMWDLAYEIKEGVFATALVRPISFYQVCFLRNLTWRLIRPTLFLPFFLLLLVLYRPYLAHASVHVSPAFFATLILGHLLSFSWVMAIAMIALFVQEAQSIFELYYVPLIFLSGQLFPVALLPGWARSISQVLPFYYTLGAPTEILVGRVQGAAINHVLIMQVTWIVISYGVSKVLWRVGLKHYSAVGM
jgi:ABC-2 type transport system permease protein